MRIETPANYNIVMTEQEDTIIVNICTVLEDIREKMIQKDCTILEWEDSGSQVSLSGIDELIETLDTLRYVNIMF